MHKYDDRYEKQIILLAEERIKTGKYKVFDRQARVITRKNLPELAAAGKTEDENCLVIANQDGETIVITKEFEQILFNAFKNR